MRNSAFKNVNLEFLSMWFFEFIPTSLSVTVKNAQLSKRMLFLLASSETTLLLLSRRKKESFTAHVAINNSKESENMWKEGFSRGFGIVLCVCAAVKRKDFAFSHIECLAMILLWGVSRKLFPHIWSLWYYLLKKGSKAFCRIRWF